MPEMIQLMTVKEPSGTEIIIGLDRDGRLWRGTLAGRFPSPQGTPIAPTIHWDKYTEV